RIIPSSSFSIDPSLKAEERVLALCSAAGASVYVNAIGGQSLYSREAFGRRGIQLQFLKTNTIEYPQFGGPFVASLSIIDVMMFNTVGKIGEFIDTGYELV